MVDDAFAEERPFLQSLPMNQLPLVVEGVTFTDGVAANDTENRAA